MIDLPVSIPTPTYSLLSTFPFTVITVDNQGKEIKRVMKHAKFFTQNLPNQIRLEMVYIPSGIYAMGSPSHEGYDSEEPQHLVTVSAFYMAKYPITQAQWEAVASLPKITCDLKANPAWFKGKNRPVDSINWFEAVEFCARLAKYSGKDYRLPSEAEWEYSCRGGTTTPFYFGPTLTSHLANYRATSAYGEGPTSQYRGETTNVGTFFSNAFGLYDMHGNVWEWCADVWHGDYDNAPSNGSIWLDHYSYCLPEEISNYTDQKYANYSRVLRGGSCFNYPDLCRSAYRFCNLPNNRHDSFGCRVALSVVE